MAKIYRDNAEISRSRSTIASNSLALTNGDFVQISGGFLITGTSGKVIGMANGTKTYASDNQTVAQLRASYTLAQPTTEFEITIGGGPITIADEGVSYYNLIGNVIDGMSKSAVESYVNTADVGFAADAVIKMQFKLVKFISATKGIFVAVQ